jgi:hypothetical protein
MVTNYPQQLAATATTEARNDGDSNGFMARMVARMGQAVCGLHGHDSVLHFEGNRVMMRCTSCGYDSPGWEISGQGPRLRYHGDAERHLMPSSRSRLVA